MKEMQKDLILIQEIGNLINPDMFNHPRIQLVFNQFLFLIFLEVIEPGLNGPLLSFKQFMEMQKDPIPLAQCDTYYFKYKKAYEKKQNDIFFLTHKVKEN